MTLTDSGILGDHVLSTWQSERRKLHRGCQTFPTEKRLTAVQASWPVQNMAVLLTELTIIHLIFSRQLLSPRVVENVTHSALWDMESAIQNLKFRFGNKSLNVDLGLSYDTS